MLWLLSYCQCVVEIARFLDNFETKCLLVGGCCTQVKRHCFYHPQAFDIYPLFRSDFWMLRKIWFVKHAEGTKFQCFSDATTLDLKFLKNPYQVLINKRIKSGLKPILYCEKKVFVLINLIFLKGFCYFIRCYLSLAIYDNTTNWTEEIRSILETEVFYLKEFVYFY